MRALLFDQKLRFENDYPRPEVRAGEVLIRVHLAGICGTDLEILDGYLGFRGVPGHEFVGTVVEGSAALQGRRVAAEINCVCGRCDMCSSGLSSHCRRRTVVGISGRDGAFAEFVSVPEQNCHEIPAGISDAEAVFVEPLAAAIQITRQIKIESRMRIAVLGSGRLGLLVAQMLSTLECRVAVVGRNPRTLGLLDRRGIQTLTASEITQRYDHDVVIDCTGSPEGLTLAMQLVRPRGTIVLKTTCARQTPIDLAPLVINEVTLLGSRCGPFADAIAMLARKQIDVLSLVTQTFPLSRGLDAFEAARSPESIKVLLQADK